MPLPQPQLDDKKFEVLVAEATKIIPRQAPEWTDHNRHDPGITLVELFAWLTEMQQFYLNTIGQESYLKFLRILGTNLESAKSARTEINFRLPATGTGLLVPQGTRLINTSLEEEGRLVFETGSPLLVLPHKLKKVLTSTRLGLKDNTAVNSWDGLSYFAFGENAEADSKLYLGVDQAFPAGEQIGITFDLAEDFSIARGQHDGEETLPLPSALVVWEYYNSAGEWAPLEISAAIDLLLSDLEQKQAALANGCFVSFDQLLASIKASPTFANLNPTASSLLEQALAAAGSLRAIRRFLSDPQFLLAKGDGTLMLSQSGRLFFKAPADMHQFEDHPLNDELLFWLRATVKETAFELSPQVEAISLNTIDAFQRDTAAELISYSSDGSPNQSFHSSTYLSLYAASVVQVRERDGLWKDWEPKENLNTSGPADRHYVLAKDTQSGIATLTFGDGAKGRIPPQGKGLVRLISYLTEFEEERKLGGSNGLPGQSFTLERTNARAEQLLIQVEERVVLPETVTETVNVSCLLEFSRTTTVKTDQPVKVSISLKAKTELCHVRVKEDLGGELLLVSSDWPAEQTTEEVEPQNWIAFEVERLAANSTRTWTYTLDAEHHGGSISGEIVITTGANCPTITTKSPSSLIEIQESLADSRWRDWIRVEDFDASGPSDPHFVFDATANAIIFGDGINGNIPQASAGERNLRLVSLQTCAGDLGNVVSETISRFDKPFEVNLPAKLLALEFSQVASAIGGKASETIDDGQVRTREDLRTQYQAVTSADFEFLATSTPGLRVARAKAIPLFSAGNKSDQRASVTVVVLPFGLSPKPVPSENFLRTVCRHLDRHRLITTQVEVVAPNYVRVTVQATVKLQSGFDSTVARGKVVDELNKFLRPIPEAGDTVNLGWPFGRTVYKSEIYQLIENVESVDCVEDVFLTAEGLGAGRDKNGNITITPTSVVFSGDHQIDALTPELECRRERG